MAEDPERVNELRRRIEDLESEVERFRTATEDALQQLDWCIGYFTGTNRRGIAHSLSANRSYIRRHLMHRQEMAVPVEAAKPE
ncbi:MAG TPA: hypothetical protein VFX33_11885 [Actinomycetales bacterium]|nr:hypothetical protein [Actinomycetales bacterium]